jgi:hypothetical protein
MASKRPGKKNEASPSPLDEKRRALLEHERKINEEIERRTRLIADAPKIKQEQAKRRRDEILNRKSRVETGSNTRAALHDKRHVFDANAATVRPGPRLKREQRRGMLTFFVLLVVFACVIAWILTLFRPS